MEGLYGKDMVGMSHLVVQTVRVLRAWGILSPPV